MIIHIFNQQNSLPINCQLVEKIVLHVLKEEAHGTDEVSVTFVDKEEISRLHGEYFDDPSPTDCISFPMDNEAGSPYRLLGDIFVCPETAIEYAKEAQADPYQELTLYIVHGLLHLLGYDDIEESDLALMRQTEARHMDLLKKSNLVLSP